MDSDGVVVSTLKINVSKEAAEKISELKRDAYAYHKEKEERDAHHHKPVARNYYSEEEKR